MDWGANHKSLFRRFIVCTLPSEIESFADHKISESEWRVNAITREDIFHVRLDAIAMTNRNVTPTRKLLFHTHAIGNRDRWRYIWRSCCEKTAAVESSSSREKKNEGVADGWRSMSCTRDGTCILFYTSMPPSLSASPRDFVTSHIPPLST